MQYMGPGSRFGLVATADIGNEVLSETSYSDMICGWAFDKLNMDTTNSVSCLLENVTICDNTLISNIDDLRLGDASKSAYYKLIYELLKAENSRWKEYIDVFPSYSAFAKYMPYMWSEETISIWRSYGDSYGDMRYQHAKNTFKNIIKIGENVCMRFENRTTSEMRRVLCDKKLLKWAYQVFQTRAWWRYVF